MKILSFFWKIIKNIKFFIITLLITFSLLVNIILFVGGTLYSVINNSFEAITGLSSIASKHKTEIADLNKNLITQKKLNKELKLEVADISETLVNERKLKRELKVEVADLSETLVNERKLKRELTVEVADLSENLVNERKLKRELTEEVADLSKNLVNERKLKRELTVEVASLSDNLMNRIVPFKGKKVKLKDAVNQTADTITKRAVISSRRNVSSMAGEALPWVGAAVIVGVTALEVNDLCMTIRDMNELKKAFNEDYTDDGSELSVCSMKIPSRSVIVDKIKNSPSDAWETAKNITPSIEDLKNIEIPDVNWEEFWKSSKSGFSGTWSSTKGVSKDFWDKTKNWWNN